MRYPTLTAFIIFAISFNAMTQTRYMDRAGKASFFSEAPLENIEAHNDQVLSLLDPSSGEIAASMLMKSFQFKKALMQEHFNEKYIESDKFPKATFKGKIVDKSKLDITKDGNYSVEVEGEITIHGETQPLKTKVDFVVKDKNISANSTFNLRVKDFKITIPSLVVKNIAEVVEVKVAFNYKPSS
ncbi:MAG TPA: YceI family protein [Cyclobacteriaceae bacterium]|nr:YceI family protein [Cyclobacteriaceae bacterium]